MDWYEQKDSRILSLPKFILNMLQLLEHLSN